MARPKNPVPKYTLHKSSGQARIWLNGREVYLGLHGSEESRREYSRIVAELTTGATVEQALAEPAAPTVDEVLLQFWAWAVQYYRRPDGTPSAALGEYKLAVRPLRTLYGLTPAKSFGPLALKTVRQQLGESGTVCRKTINARVGKLKRIFKWGVENELVPVTTYTALATVAGLQAGRSTASDHEPVTPVDDAIVNATLPHLSRHLRGLVQFLRLTGCRPSEAAGVRRCLIDTTGDVWMYAPKLHKMAHKGKPRIIAVGPKAQEVLKQFFTDGPTDYLFSPRRAVEERNVRRRAERKTPLTPSQKNRKPLANPKRPPSERYKRQAILNAVVRACERAGVAAWHPYQLRHTHATEVRKRYGLESAGAALGHSKMSATQVYAERDATLATKVAAEMG